MYQFPDMAQKAFHLAINSNGAIIDAIHASASDRDVKFRTVANGAVHCPVNFVNIHMK